MVAASPSVQMPGAPVRPERLIKLWNRLNSFIKAGNPWVQARVLVLLGLGWLLSPMCWWNDLVFNLPLAYGVGWLVKQMQPAWFAGGLIAGYWLSNVVGIVLMQTSALEVFQDPDQPQKNLRNELAWGLLTSSVYTLVVYGLVHWGVIHTPIPELG
jgi:hypothetical protein